MPSGPALYVAEEIPIPMPIPRSISLPSAILVQSVVATERGRILRRMFWGPGPIHRGGDPRFGGTYLGFSPSGARSSSRACCRGAWPGAGPMRNRPRTCTKEETRLREEGRPGHPPPKRDRPPDRAWSVQSTGPARPNPSGTRILASDRCTRRRRPALGRNMRRASVLRHTIIVPSACGTRPRRPAARTARSVPVQGSARARRVQRRRSPFRRTENAAYPSRTRISSGRR